MQLKTIVELLSLSTNLYVLSKDEELMKTLENFAEKSKSGLDNFLSEYSEDEYSENYSEDGGHQIVKKLLEKAKHAKEELDKKMEEIAINIYEKMNIAHTNEVEALKNEIEGLKRELALTEARVVHLEEK